MRVCLVLIGGAEDGPVRGTGELIRQCARVVTEAGGEVITALYPASNMLRAVEEYTNEIVAMAPASGRSQVGRNLTPMLRVTRKLRPDIVHFHVPNYRWGLDAIMSARSAPRSCRVVRTEHNPLMGVPSRPWRVVLRAADAAVDQFAYCSVGNQRRWEAALGWRAGRGTVHLNMVDPARFADGAAPVALPPLPDSSRRAAFVSASWNLYDTDGRRPLAPVLHALGKVARHWHLIVVGDGDVAGADWVAGAPGIEGRVHFLGPVPDAWRVVRDADLLVNASHFEGMSISILEAWSMGVPVLSTRVDGIEDVVGATGLAAVTAEIGDVDTFAARWDEALDPASEFRRINARATVEVCSRFTRERWAAQLLELYQPGSVAGPLP